MVEVVDVFNFGPAISVSALKPGQIGKICGNGGNLDYVIGVPHSYVRDEPNRPNRPVYAIRLSDGSFVDNSSTSIFIFPDHWHLELRPSKDMGAVK